MITKFDSLYAGHVDMDNVGYGGTAVNDRRFPNEYLVTTFDKAQAIAQTMDEQGFDAFWLAEHHFQPEGYECIPNVLLLALHLTHHDAAPEHRLRLQHRAHVAPLRLAEDYATVDALTGGRVIFGVGRGYHTREIETFGSPLLDQAANRELFEEQVEIILKSFREESFSHRGKNYTLPPEVPYRGYDLKEISLVPRPLRQPVECWQPIQSASPRALDFMAKHGIKGIIGGGVAEGGAMHKVVESLPRRRYPHRPRGRARNRSELWLPLTTWRPTREQAIKEAAPGSRKTSRCSARCASCAPSATSKSPTWATPPRRPPPASRASSKPSTPAASSAAHPTWSSNSSRPSKPATPASNGSASATPSALPQQVIVEQLEWFARDVMPAFKDRESAMAPAD